MSSAIVAETNIEESDFPMLAGKTQKLAILGDFLFHIYRLAIPPSQRLEVACSK